MREIKFRYVVQHEETGYITSEIFTYDEIEVGCVNNWLASIPRYFVVSKDQYSGLHDKNGKEIYEGDVDDSNGENMVVTYQDGCYGLKYQLCEGEDGEYFDSCISWGRTNIIGNIYVSPELLEGGTSK